MNEFIGNPQTLKAFRALKNKELKTENFIAYCTCT